MAGRQARWGNLVASEAFCSNASRAGGNHGYESVHTERGAVGQRGEALLQKAAEARRLPDCWREREREGARKRAGQWWLSFIGSLYLATAAVHAEQRQMESEAEGEGINDS